MTGQWSPERANEWFASIPLPFGCNFLPSTAVNSTEMWQADSFGPATFEHELQLAAGLGYNTVRVFLQFVVWEADPEGHTERLETFLRLADAAGISMMPILFDDCRFDDATPTPGARTSPSRGCTTAAGRRAPATPPPTTRRSGRSSKRTQTYLHWYTRYSPEPGSEPRLWLHDVMRPDGELCDPAEAAVLRAHAGEDWALEPAPMTPRLMAHLEELGLIIRLRPGGHGLAAQPGETLGESIYESADRYGPHKLIAVTVNRAEFAAFGTHLDNEEFLLIGNPDSQPMYLAMALRVRAEFEEKVKTGRLSAADLVLIECRYNVPEVSFFVMLADVPHGEAIVLAAGKPTPPASMSPNPATCPWT